MIMVLCLFVHAKTEFQQRQNLEVAGETVTSQKKKQN